MHGLKCGFNCLKILDVSLATRSSLRRAEWLETAQHAKLTQCHQLMPCITSMYYIQWTSVDWALLYKLINISKLYSIQKVLFFSKTWLSEEKPWLFEIILLRFCYYNILCYIIRKTFYSVFNYYHYVNM